MGRALDNAMLNLGQKDIAASKSFEMCKMENNSIQRV
jgi:hypothetical protein